MRRVAAHKWMMGMAKHVAERSTCPRGRIGAVVTIDGRIIAIGYNGSPPDMDHCDDVGCLHIDQQPGCVRTIHAEQNAINFAARKGIATEGATLYCTHTPCLSCAKSIIAAGIEKVIADEEYRIVDGVNLLKDAGIPVHLLRGQFLVPAPSPHIESGKRSEPFVTQHHIPSYHDPESFETADGLKHTLPPVRRTIPEVGSEPPQDECRICDGILVTRSEDGRSLICENGHHSPDPAAGPVEGIDRIVKGSPA